MPTDPHDNSPLPGGAVGGTEPARDEMAAFDALPAVIRSAMRDLVCDMSAIDVLDYLAARPHASARIIADRVRYIDAELVAEMRRRGEAPPA